MNFRFSIKWLLLSILLVSQSLAIFILQSKLNQASRELPGFRKELGHLVVTDPDKLHHTANLLETSGNWSWRIYAPKGRFALRIGNPKSNTAIVSMLVKGPCEFSTLVEGEQDLDSDWKLRINSTHNSGFRVETDELPSELETLMSGNFIKSWSTGYSSETIVSDPSSKVNIHQINFDDVSFGIWIEPLEDSASAR